jgi:ribosome biogenesis GTPase
MKRDTMVEGIVYKSQGSLYGVKTDEGFLRCWLKGSLKQNDLRVIDPVAVGDRVMVKPIDNQQGVIEKILPRKSKLSRPDVLTGNWEQCIVVNADQLIIVHSCKSPKLKLRSIDRYLVMAEVGHLKPIVCINKLDLDDNNRVMSELKVYGQIGYSTLFTSGVTGEGIGELMKAMKDRISVVVGPSGVGKSTLLNTIQPGLNLRTSEVSLSTNKGKHATSWVELMPLDIGGYVVDTPGLRAVGLWGVTKNNLGSFFPEIKERMSLCRFPNCSHIHEPDCEVKMAVEAGEVNTKRYDSYMRILRSL